MGNVHQIILTVLPWQDSPLDWRRDERGLILSSCHLPIQWISQACNPKELGGVQGNIYKMQNNRDVNIEINTRELCGAVKGGNLAIVDSLLQNPEVDVNGEDGADGATPLIIAVRSGHQAIVRRLLQHPGIRLGKERGNGLAFDIACLLNDVSIMKLLCQDRRFSPGIINKKNSNGDTPLMFAVYWGHLDIVKELDREGTDFFLLAEL